MRAPPTFHETMAAVGDDCLFCRIVAGEIPADVVAETDARRRVPRPQPAGAPPRPRRTARARRRRRRAGRPRAGDRRRAGRSRPPGRRRRGPRQLPPGVQHRRRRRPDRVPRPPARARRPEPCRGLPAEPAGRPRPPVPSPSSRAAATAPASTDAAADADRRARARAPLRSCRPTLSRRSSRSRLRAGETRMTLRIPKTYTPSAPNGVGTDDYRCFLLDPHLTRTSSSPAPS